MVTIREEEYQGLRLKLTPTDGKGFYLTGDESLFKLVVMNLEERKRTGKLGLRWRYGTGSDAPASLRIVTIELDPKETKEYIINKELHMTEGGIVCTVEDIGPPESHEATDVGQMEKWLQHQSPTYHVICTYKVIDRAQYEADTRRHEEVLAGQREITQRLQNLKEEIMRETDERLNNASAELRAAIIAEVTPYLSEKGENAKKQLPGFG